MNKFTTTNGERFDELEFHQRFLQTHIPVQELCIERDDPSSTIAEMFSRLNTSSTKLSDGELFKSHGWKHNIPIIELSKKIIGSSGPFPWTIDDTDDDEIITALRDKWNEAFGTDLSEKKRCDNMAMMCGFIISAITTDFRYFDKKYAKLKGYIDHPLTQQEKTSFLLKMNTFLDILDATYSVEIFGRCQRGMPPKLMIAPVWKKICEETMTDQFKEGMIEFYQQLEENTNIKKQYMHILQKGGDNHTTGSKIGAAISFIRDWWEEE